jgi:hypothetical protein
MSKEEKEEPSKIETLWNETKGLINPSIGEWNTQPRGIQDFFISNVNVYIKTGNTLGIQALYMFQDTTTAASAPNQKGN